MYREDEDKEDSKEDEDKIEYYLCEVLYIHYPSNILVCFWLQQVWNGLALFLCKELRDSLGEAVLSMKGMSQNVPQLLWPRHSLCIPASVRKLSAFLLFPYLSHMLWKSLGKCNDSWPGSPQEPAVLKEAYSAITAGEAFLNIWKKAKLACLLIKSADTKDSWG